MTRLLDLLAGLIVITIVGFPLWFVGLCLWCWYWYSVGVG